MVVEIILQSMFSVIAGLTVAVATALLAEYREKRRWLQTEVYQPVYGELTESISGDLPVGEEGYASLWADLGYYKTYRVDATLAEALDRYASELSELSGLERDTDVQAFVDALPASLCDRETATVELSSGRTIDVRRWLRRNALVLSTADQFQDHSFGFDSEELAYLWEEVDGVTSEQVDGEPYDTEAALAAVSREFNWGYEPLYDQWDEEWMAAVTSAFLTAVERPESTLREALAARRDIGASASDIKTLIKRRTDKGILQTLWERRLDS